ncbi:hypothetical protein Tco_0559950 [Tanacetum coccineum]
MDDSNHNMEEYIKLEAEKAHKRGQTFNWETATYGKLRYHEDINYFKDFETDFSAIDFDDPLATNHKISSEPTYSIDMGYTLHLFTTYGTTTTHGLKVLFTSHAWRRLFEIQGPLVCEFMLEFFSTCKISDTVLELDAANTLCFQLGGVSHSMSWRQFILALGLHTDKEMAGDGFDGIASDGDFLEMVPSYTSIRNPLRRLCHRLIAVSIFDRRQSPDK